MYIFTQTYIYLNIDFILKNKIMVCNISLYLCIYITLMFLILFYSLNIYWVPTVDRAILGTWNTSVKKT